MCAWWGMGAQRERGKREASTNCRKGKRKGKKEILGPVGQVRGSADIYIVQNKHSTDMPHPSIYMYSTLHTDVAIKGSSLELHREYSVLVL